MIFTNVKNNNTSLKLIQEHYAVIIENYDTFIGVCERGEYDQITEQDMGILNAKAADFIESAHKFIDDAKNNRQKHIDDAQAYLYIGLGLSLVAMFAAIPGTAIAVTIALLALVGSIIMLVIGSSKVDKGEKEFNKIEGYKTELIKLKSKTNDPKIKAKIDSIIERITHELDVDYKKKLNIAIANR